MPEPSMFNLSFDDCCYRAPRSYTDIHCHCLPNIDDGPATMSEAIILCRAMISDGITSAIATPHQLGLFGDSNQAAQIRENVCGLNKELKNNGISLVVSPGADVRVDERICRLLKEDKILTLADNNRYILLELPHQIFIDIEPLLSELFSMGIRAVISHPERHSILSKQHQLLFKWFEYSPAIQITAGSILGDFGPVVKMAAWQFLTSGWTVLIATDSHDTQSRRPRMRAAFELISIELGRDVASLVCIENPVRILKGEDVLTIPVCRHKEVR